MRTCPVCFQQTPPQPRLSTSPLPPTACAPPFPPPQCTTEKVLKLRNRLPPVTLQSENVVCLVRVALCPTSGRSSCTVLAAQEEYLLKKSKILDPRPDSIFQPVNS